MVIELLGKEYELEKPRGRKGMRMMRSIQAAWQRQLNLMAEAKVLEIDAKALGALEGKDGAQITSVTVQATAKMIGFLNSTVLTDEFLDDVVVPLMMISTEKLKKPQAMKRIEEYTFDGDVAGKLFQALQLAVEFWAGDVDDPEALKEAVGKSPAAAEAAISR